MTPTKITSKKAKEMIVIIDKDDNSKLGVIKLGKFYYDVTDCEPEQVLEFIKEHNKRAINRSEFGATRL